MIDKQTKVMARLHHTDNSRGLQIYNPYFQEAGENAVYLLFHNKNLTPLLEGLKNLNLAGAIPAGFETDPELAKHMDKLDPIAQAVGKVGIIKQREGQLIGEYQAGYGLDESVTRLTKLDNKSVVIFGAGQVVHALLEVWNQKDRAVGEVVLYNRTPENAKALAGKYPQFVKQVHPMEKLSSATGDIFINATYAGSPWGEQDDDVFTPELISQFDYFADVTFVPLEPKLVKLAREAGKPVSPGWKMFLYQGIVCLEYILDITVDEDILAKHIQKDFKTNWQ